MKDILTPLLFLQRFFLPALWLLTMWALWRTVIKKDAAVGLAFYLGLVIIVDGFLNTAIYLPGLASGSIRYSELCAGFLLLTPRATSSRTTTPVWILGICGLYFLLLALSVFRTEQLFLSAFDFRARVIPQMVALLVAVRGDRSPEFFRRFLLGMMALCILIGLFVLFDLLFERWLLFSEQLLKPEYGATRRWGRFGSFFLNPNYLGAFVVLMFPSVFVATMNEQVKWARLLGIVTMLSLVFCLVETQSRGPLLAMGGVIVLLLFGPAGRLSRLRRVGVFAAVMLLFVVLMPGFFTRATGRFDQIQEEMSTESARTRETIWLYTMRAIADNPLMGIGFGERQFQKSIMYDYGFLYAYGAESLDNPHNSYLQMTVYAGIPALLTFLAANLVLFLRAMQWVLQRAQSSHVVFGLAVGVVGFLAVIYPDMHMFTPNVAPVYWTFFGLLMCLVTQTTPALAESHSYEDRRSNVGNPLQRLAGQPTAVTPRHRWAGDRTATARVDHAGENRAATPVVPTPWRAPRHQQAPAQQSAGWRPVQRRRPHSQGELLPWRGLRRVRTTRSDRDH